MVEHAPPFQNGIGTFEIAILGAIIILILAVISLILIVYKRDAETETEQTEEETKDYRIDQTGLSRRAEEILEQVLEDPILQSEMPEELSISKSTVSNAVGELFERNLVKKKKKGNTYLIEPNEEEIEYQER